MKKTQTGLSSRKLRRTPRKSVTRRVALPVGLPLGTQQALMGLAAYEARHQ